MQAHLLSRLYVDTMYTTVTGELLPVKQEILNDHDPFAVAILKDGEVVGHVPKSVSEITYFLQLQW